LFLFRRQGAALCSRLRWAWRLSRGPLINRCGSELRRACARWGRPDLEVRGGRNGFPRSTRASRLPGVAVANWWKPSGIAGGEDPPLTGIDRCAPLSH
jgi:hypothetical protein